MLPQPDSSGGAYPQESRLVHRFCGYPSPAIHPPKELCGHLAQTMPVSSVESRPVRLCAKTDQARRQPLADVPDDADAGVAVAPGSDVDGWAGAAGRVRAIIHSAPAE